MAIAELVTKVFNSIGNSAKTRAPESQDMADAALHELAVAQALSTLAEQRLKLAKDRLNSVVPPTQRDKLMTIKAFVKKEGLTQNVELVDAQYYNVSARLTKGPSWFDLEEAKAELATIWGDAATEVFVKKHTKQRDPAVTFVVTEH